MKRRTLPFAARSTLVLALLAGAVVLLTLNSGAGDPAPQAEAAFPGNNGKIAFSTDRDGNAEVYVMNADGSAQTNITSDAANDTRPAWSANAGTIAFQSDRDGNNEVYVMNADGSAQTNLTNNAAVDESPHWSPSGTELAFHTDRDGNNEIYSMNADGSAQTNLTNDIASDIEPAWSPDGSKIAFTSDRDGNAEVYVMNADGSGQTNLTNDAATDSDPVWSPDGSRIAFTTDRDGNFEVYAMNADGSVPTNLSNNAANDAWKNWSPDGAKIAFTTDRDTNDEVYVMNADGSGQTNISNDAADDGDPDWQPQSVARLITDPDDLIGGGLSRGRLGDYYLSNGKVQFVVQKPQRNLLNVGQYGGQIIDADLVRAPGDPERDHFEEFAFGINIENTAHYTSVTVLNDGSNGEPAVIRATGVDDLLDFINPSTQAEGFGLSIPPEYNDVDLPVSFVTDYILTPGADYVEVETTVTNTSPTQTVDTFITEFIGGSGDLEIFLPGYGFGEVLVSSACDLCNILAWNGEGDATGVSYGYIYPLPESTSFTTSGVSIVAHGVNAVAAILGAEDPNYSIAPLGQASVTRYFAVGDDLGSIIDTRNRIMGLTTGTIQGTVTRGGSPVEGADVTVLGDPLDGPGTTKNVVAHYRTDVDGNYSGTLPVDDYTVRANVDGHMPASPNPGSVTITAGATSTQNFTIPTSGQLQVLIEDEASNPIAAKVSIIGFDANPDPGNTAAGVNTAIFGEVFQDGLPYGLADVVFVDHSGDSGEVFLEPGNYRIVASHGTEYSSYAEDITVTAGNLTTVNAQIARVIDTTGFVSGDFHVHQIDSPDSEVAKDERIVSMLAEGVDFFTPTDHEHRTDLSSVITDLGAGGLISVAPGNETTTADYGHFNAWPMTIDPTKVNGGAIDWAGEAPVGQDFPSFGNYTKPPSQIFDELLADPGVDTVQINHIDSFFGAGGLNVDTAYEPPQDFADNASRRLDPAIVNLFDDSFTALESWQGSDRGDTLTRFVGRNMGDWFNMLNQGIVRSSVADSDTHATISSQSGFPRTMVASPTDDVTMLDDIADTLAGNVNSGHATGTNGPFVKVTSSAASTSQSGGLGHGEATLIETTDGEATITVDIQSPLWAPFDRVEYYVTTVPTIDDFDSNANTPPFYHVAPQIVQDAGDEFVVNDIDDFPSIPGARHLEATTSATLTGLTADAWVVVLVRGTDNVSEPLFPVLPNNISSGSNPTLADLIDGNLGESGVTAMAFSNPLFIDADGDAGYDHPEVDSDGDGCTNKQEVGPNQLAGGKRSPSNPHDYFNPTDDRKNRIDDVLAVVGQYFDDDTDANPGLPPYAPGYDPDTDRTDNPASSEDWDLLIGNGQQRIDDILAIIKQYFHDCA